MANKQTTTLHCSKKISLQSPPLSQQHLEAATHGCAGLIVEPVKYLTMTGGTAFTLPANPGIYPAKLALNAAAGTWARKEALNKELIAQYEILKGVK
jgi:hypothetical protein